MSDKYEDDREYLAYQFHSEVDGQEHVHTPVINLSKCVQECSTCGAILNDLNCLVEAVLWARRPLLDALGQDPLQAYLERCYAVYRVHVGSLIHK